MIKAIILSLVFLISAPLTAKIRILTFHYNQADFIELQYRTLRKFLKDDFELIVFNDAKTAKNEQAINNACQKHRIHCVRFKPEWHLTDPLNAYLKMRLEEPETIAYWGWNASTTMEEFANHASVRHCHAIQYALDHYGYDHDDIVVLWDGDNFLIKPLSIRELLGTKDLIAFNQRADLLGEKRKQGILRMPKDLEMPWVVFTAFNPSKLPDVRDLHFHVDVISGHPHLPHNTISDTGAAIYKYLWAHPELKTETYPWQNTHTYRHYFSYDELKKMDFSDRLIQFIHDIAPGNVQFFLLEHFVHFGGGSTETPEHLHKVHHLHQFMNDLLKS